MEDVYFPLRRRKDLFFETPLQGRTHFGHTCGQTCGQTSQGREHGNRRNATTAGSAGQSEVIDGIAQGVEGQAGLSNAGVNRLFVARGLALMPVS